MAIFTPISSELSIQQSTCEMVDLAWSGDHLEAVFKTGDEFICVTFEQIVTARISDESVFSAEAEPRTGLRAEGFAYSVEGGTMLTSLPAAARQAFRNIRQYAFVSSSACLDVPSTEPPSFEQLEPQG